RSVGLSERPNPGRSGAMQRKPASRTGGMTLRHRNDQLGSPWTNTAGAPSPSSRCARRIPSHPRNVDWKGKSGSSPSASSGAGTASTIDLLPRPLGPARMRLVDGGESLLEREPSVDLHHLALGLLVDREEVR